MKTNLVSNSRIVLFLLIGFLTVFFLNTVSADGGDAEGGIGIVDLTVTDGDSDPDDDPNDNNQNNQNANLDNDSDNNRKRRSHNSNTNDDIIINEDVSTIQLEVNYQEDSIVLHPIQEKITLGSNNNNDKAKQPNQKIITIVLTFSSSLLLLFIFILILTSTKITKSTYSINYPSSPAPNNSLHPPSTYNSQPLPTTKDNTLPKKTGGLDIFD